MKCELRITWGIASGEIKHRLPLAEVMISLSPRKIIPCISCRCLLRLNKSLERDFFRVLQILKSNKI